MNHKDDGCTCVDCLPGAEMKYRLMISREDQADATILHLSGRLDANTSQDHGQDIMQAMEEAPALILDLTGLNYMASAGIRVLLMTAKQAHAAGKTMELRNLHPNVHEVLQMVGMLEIFGLE
jgi:anti-sigma B factor antagonist